MAKSAILDRPSSNARTGRSSLAQHMAGTRSVRSSSQGNFDERHPPQRAISLSAWDGDSEVCIEVRSLAPR